MTMRKTEQKFGKYLDEEVKIGVRLAMEPPAEPLPIQIPHLEELRAGQDCAIRMLPNTSGTPPLYPWTSPCWETAKAKAREVNATREQR